MRSCRQILVCLLIGFLLTSSSHGQLRPNVVLINADDLGYGDLGCYGATKLKTPNIDRLATTGRRFTDAHSASAVCSPSRYGLMTGRYPLRKNFWGPVGLRSPLTIETNRLTLPRLMKQAGYRTACIGKWHLGFGLDEPDYNGDLKPGPLELGFDYFYGIPRVNSGPPFVYVEDHRVVGLDADAPFEYGAESSTEKWPEKSGYSAIGGAADAHRLYQDEQVATVLANKAVEWLRKQDDRTPFFLYLATTNIHHPFTPARRFVGSSQCGRYGDFVQELDWVVGRLLSVLADLKLQENTLVIFTSDNGGMLNATAQQAWSAGHRINGALQGFKFGAWEGGHRVPLIARWPGKIPAGTVSDQLISQVDLVATLASIVGCSIQPGQAEDSVDQYRCLTGESRGSLRDELMISPNSPMHLTLRQGSWVYIPAPGEGGFQGKKPGDHLFSGVAALPFVGRTNSDVADGLLKPNAPLIQLYDLAADPGQTMNRASDYPDRVEQMDARLQQFRDAVPDGEPLGWINLKQK